MKELLKKIKNEDGAIAIITIFFLSTVGIISILALWSIGVATGAYNKLYVANQSAAFSAVTTTIPTEGFEQPVFDCQNEEIKTFYQCKKGTGYNTFKTVFQETLSGGSGFGIDPNKLTTPTSCQPNSSLCFDLKVFNFRKNSSQAKKSCQEEGSTSDIVSSGDGEVVCWRVSENIAGQELKFGYQYSSGVLARAQARIPSIPTLNSCNDTIYGFGCVVVKVVASASVSQVNQSDYSFYEVN
jgi:hypothetical protein